MRKAPLSPIFFRPLSFSSFSLSFSHTLSFSNFSRSQSWRLILNCFPLSTSLITSKLMKSQSAWRDVTPERREAAWTQVRTENFLMISQTERDSGLCAVHSPFLPLSPPLAVTFPPSLCVPTLLSSRPTSFAYLNTAGIITLETINLLSFCCGVLSLWLAKSLPHENQKEAGYAVRCKRLNPERGVYPSLPLRGAMLIGEGRS